MSFTPSVDDLRLIAAVHRHGSIGTAARELLVSQPSASARLASVERRLGVTLFERDTTGARATDAGRAFAAEADHILGHVAQLADRVRAGAGAPLLRAATFPSLSALFFPALDAAVAELADGSGPELAVHQYVDHGDVLVGLVAEGSLDLAVVGLADQLPLPSNLTTTRLGSDRLAMLTPSGWTPGNRRRPFTGVVPYHCLDLSGPMIEQRISDLGGRPRLCATAEVAVITARRTGRPALLARSIAALYVRRGEAIVPSPFPVEFVLHAVTRTPPAQYVPDLLRRIALAADLALTKDSPSRLPPERPPVPADPKRPNA